MSSEDSVGLTLAMVDPSLLSSWEAMVKRGEECSLMLKHSKGKITATLQCTTPTPSLARSSSPSPTSPAKKRKKRKEARRRGWRHFLPITSAWWWREGCLQADWWRLRLKPPQLPLPHLPRALGRSSSVTIVTFQLDRSTVWKSTLEEATRCLRSKGTGKNWNCHSTSRSQVRWEKMNLHLSMLTSLC